MAKSKEHMLMDALERQNEWVEAFKDYIGKVSIRERNDIMDKKTGILMDIFRLQALCELALKDKHQEDMRYAIMKHQNLRSKISKRYKILLR